MAMQPYHQQPAARSSSKSNNTNNNTGQGGQDRIKGRNKGMARTRRSGPTPGVMWVDDGRSENLGFRTFYREDTPEPEPGPSPGPRTGLEPELDDWSSTTNIGQPVGLYDYKYDHVAPPAPIPISATTCGITRRALWLGLAAAAVLVTLGVGIGVGVGVAGSGHKSEG